MAKRKKYPKLPNGFGSIRYLGGSRRNPYAVHPPTKEFTVDGVPLRQKALCYVDTWAKGFAVLNAYKAGTYCPGWEKSLEMPNTDATGDIGKLVDAILADYCRIKGADEKVLEKKKTFNAVYEEFYDYKFRRDKSRTYSRSTIYATQAAYKNCAALHGMAFADLRHADLQEVIDNCSLKYSSKELIVTLLKQMYAYAAIMEIVDKDYSAHLKINSADDDQSGIPFAEDELRILWKHSSDPVAEFILIMCYSGFRIAAYKSLEVNLKERYFKGGIKTASSKDRIVPIHPDILPLVKRRLRRDGCLLRSAQTFRRSMRETLEAFGISPHTPHDCRHTFSQLCERYGVCENDRKRMLGHSFGNDITNRVYGHRNLEELRAEMHKIRFVTNLCLTVSIKH